MSRRRAGRAGRTWVGAAVVVSAALVVSACGAGGDGGTATSGTSEPSSSSSSASPTPSESSDSSTSPADPSPSDPATPSPTSPPTTTPTTPTTPPSPEPTTPPAPATLGAGDSGEAVLALQTRLSDLGYWLGTPDGSFGSLTTQAVYALQGAAGLQRDGRVGAQTRAALDAGTVPTAHSTTGHVTEIDREAGLVLFVDDGRVSRVLHTSTGTFEHYEHDGRDLAADTPEGDFTVDWVHEGWREGDLGRLYAPRYFHPDGIAVHGYPSVPAQPASHGCARVTMAAMDMIWAEDLMPMDSEVLVY